MKRWMKWSLAGLVTVIVILTLASTLLERSARRAATHNGAFKDFHDITAMQLEQQIRSSLPIGSSRADVENYLTNLGMEFNFDSSENETDAVARYLKGSGFPIRSDLGIEFHFDQTDKLQSINTKVHLTGP